MAIKDIICLWISSVLSSFSGWGDPSTEWGGEEDTSGALAAGWGGKDGGGSNGPNGTGAGQWGGGNGGTDLWSAAVNKTKVSKMWLNACED